MPEYPDHIAHRQEVPDAPFKFRISQVAVVHIGEGNPEPAQHLSGGKQAALAVPQAHALFVGPLVPGTPQQHRHIQLLRQPGAFIFRAEIGMGKEQAIHLFLPEFLRDRIHARVVVEQSFVIDVVDVHEIDSQLPQPVCGQLPVLHRRRCAENSPPRWCKTQFDFCCHGFSSSNSLCLFPVFPS